MKSNLGKAALLLISSLALSHQADTNSSEDPCGLVAAELLKSDSGPLDAKLAQSCLKAIPLNKDHALETISQLRLFLQFYSAQTYFAHPPTAQLELTPVDLNGTLSAIEHNITSGAFENNYALEKSIHNLFGLYRDGHVVYTSACYTAFTFENGHPLISVADSTVDIPSVHYIETFSDGKLVGDKVVKINDMNATEYLMKMANEHPEPYWVDPDARYNQLLMGISNGIVANGLFSSRVVWDENETTKVTYENGTTVELNWTATADSRLDPNTWNSVDTFYANVCRRSSGELKKLYEEYQNPNLTQVGYPAGLGLDDTVQSSTNTQLRSRNIPPKKKVRRGDFVPTPIFKMSRDEIMFYTLTPDVGVLVINTFDADPDYYGFMHDFANNITASIDYLKRNKMKRIIIDVSGNGGGRVHLGYNAVRQFFPGEPTYFASNMRWSPALAAMMLEAASGDLDATYWDLGHYRKAVDNTDFKDLAEFLGPVNRDGDYFTQIVVDDPEEVQAEEADEPLPPFYEGAQPFKDSDIILLSSGMCGSTCAVFSEAFENHGVRTVALGGRPLAKSMQTVGGIKGCQVLKFDEIAGWAWTFLGEKIMTLDFIPKMPVVNTFKSASINLRNSWRKANQALPIEFLYTPSMYRLMYTSEMVMNITATWEAAANTVWGDDADFYEVNKVQGTADKSGKDAANREAAERYKSIGHLIWSKIHNNDEL